jgi:hypothetical protein
VLLMAAGMRLGLEPEALAPALGVACGAGVLAALAWLSARRLGWGHPLVWLPPLALALSRSFTAWSTGGLETQLFALLALLAALAFLSERERRSALPLASAGLFAAATLTRPEGALFASVAAAFRLLDVVRGRCPWRAAVAWALPLAAAVGTHAIWRRWYYGFWLPNTFYAKVNGPWLEQSAKYFSLFEADYHIAWFLPLLVAAVALRREATHRLFAALLASHLAYLAVIGGDRFEFRFLVVVFPYAYWLIVEGIRLVAGVPAAAPRAPAWRALAGAALAAALLGTTHLGSRRSEAAANRHFVESVEETRRFAEGRAAQGKLLRAAIEGGLLPRETLYATYAAGAVPYYTAWPTLDMLGLSDVRIAHTPIRGRGIIGHEHRARGAYLRERGAAIIDFSGQLVQNAEGYEALAPSLAPLTRHTRDMGRLVVAHLDARFFLLFRTTLPDDDLRRHLPRLRIEEVPEPRP